jgi:flagellar biogenesis protein FliO
MSVRAQPLADKQSAVPGSTRQYARKQNIMQNSAAVVFLLALVIVVTGWILSRLSLSPPPGNRAGGLERSKRRR